VGVKIGQSVLKGACALDQVGDEIVYPRTLFVGVTLGIFLTFPKAQRILSGLLQPAVVRLGTAYTGPDGSVVFTTTNVDSIGRGAAERWSGADLAITAEITRGNLTVRKAILAQAKLGELDDLPSSERGRLVGQVVEMRRFTRSPKVILIRELGDTREPLVASGTRIAGNLRT
jgi:hypothetical protein